MTLRKTRKILALAFFVPITLLLLDFTGSLHAWFGWLARVQLVPAILAVNVAAIVVLALLTLVFGRVYCSVVCPLGVMQDGVSHIAGKRRRHRNRFRYSKGLPWLRYGMLTLFVAALAAGVGAVVSLLDPYAAYGRIATNLLAAVYKAGNNLLARAAERADSYAFYSAEVWINNRITLGVAAATLVVAGLLAWRRGRTYCNTVCPVGTVLGFMSRHAVFHPAFDTGKCTRCGLCEKSCKASCIDSQNLTIDQSRCVACFDCMDKCNFGAIRYTSVRRKADVPQDGTAGMSRRGFLAVAGAMAAAGTVRAQQLQVEGGLAEIEDKMVPDRHSPVVPPGAEGAAHLKKHCTACQLCVSSCPNRILRPSDRLATFMQPEMSFERGYCRPECTECSQVCPSGAIRRISAADKTAVSIGNAVWIGGNCVVTTDQLPCTACERHCPTRAITLVAAPGNPLLRTPVVDRQLCIGCGACEYYCPARPFSAIYVEGHVRHHSV